MVSVYKLQSDQIKFWSIISEGNKYLYHHGILPEHRLMIVADLIAKID